MLPDGVEIEGTDYRINTDFRAGIAYSAALLMEEPVPVARLIRLFFPDRRPEDEEAALSAISDFIRCGTPAPKKESGDKAGPASFSFLTDAQALQAEFQRVYGIDLSSAEMHWWRFSALLRGLLLHSFSERVKYRLADISRIKDKDMRAHWRDMQQSYALDERGRPVRRPQTLEEYNEMLLAQARGERW